MYLVSLCLTALLATGASAAPALEKRQISCLKVGATATATWTNAAGRTCRWTGIVGSNFGTNSVNGGDYSCNGRCGAGCSGAALGNVYTQDCFSHDICSWFNNAIGGASQILYNAQLAPSRERQTVVDWSRNSRGIHFN
ncbi:hypothetical protein PSV08DRAFT_245434 [Bipolaris maydis]|uniref:uncharacterized protein n=1 Tax=Cochliobolus heterostrophus TaxID=5016 RepID=UPI0024CF7AFF|nr:hypothetical protein PSV08DRAFT_245434 [Bipolaris maydis]